MSRTDFLYLSEPDLIKTGVLDAAKCINVCEEVFRILHEGDYLMGGPNHNEHGLVLVFPKETKFEHMPVAGPERRLSLCRHISAEDLRSAEKNGMAQM